MRIKITIIHIHILLMILIPNQKPNNTTIPINRPEPGGNGKARGLLHLMTSQYYLETGDVNANATKKTLLHFPDHKPIPWKMPSHISV